MRLLSAPRNRSPRTQSDRPAGLPGSSVYGTRTRESVISFADAEHSEARAGDHAAGSALPPVSFRRLRDALSRDPDRPARACITSPQVTRGLG